MAKPLKWKSKEEDLPEENCLCVVINRDFGSNPRLASFVKNKNLFIDNIHFLALDVTHYIEIPEPD